ncbi:glycoside hydrolase family 31 protein [Conidiobolus coronatus NRRL 28638]|uniref:Glycoside hydrolase family 31 protein n=1 Tax=Conidiobolus coronatus (strain ATCC 28846 / CBS 209.66 / NRRL 28638) TaxID=796925 RepID=A0A137P3C2_CONC2|nr:glycoside hydrolase family 31 protein [Conidiobolus coronatus NRRL 28638]|eukprot:KXN69520.1 glycoside hydrolase family 31 protein [Conidiobolus coronatus NRRL 28638]
MKFNISIILGLLLNNLSSIEIQNVENYTELEGDSGVQFTSNGAKLKVSFYNNNILRIQAITKGDFIEPVIPIVVPENLKPTKTKLEIRGDHFIITGGNIGLKIYKNPVRLAMVNRDNSVIWEESKPLQFNTNQTIQTLKQNANENYFGGGMQNGRFSHRNQKINITADFAFEDGDNPNPAPFFMSTKGFGVFRNTFAPGAYDFKNIAEAKHDEERFDAYYFYGPSLKNILNYYTQVTGRPFMPPGYALEMGDSDCYYKTANGRPPRDTLTDSSLVAQGYVDNDLPLGYMIVNDGFGCEYTRLGETNQALLNRNVTLGLWTNGELTNQPTEVGQWGVRVRKLDGTWVGPGYDFSLRACRTAFNGITENSNARGFTWLIEGWSGSQQCSAMWTGDQYGTWETLRFHIPTIHGSGLSSQVYVSGDLNGIVGGDDETYIRDLQFKTFSPLFMAVSGWADYDKQPWRRGEPGTSINRKYLKLREQLLPYTYSYAYEAHATGVPITRSTVLEFPEDSKTWDSETTKYQYLFGEHILVAPVYTSTTVRNGIYLPKGKWFDYWTSKVYQGEQIINGYEAPIDRLPLLVRGGAIIPKWPQVNSFRQRKPNDKLIIELYPDFSSEKTTEFKLYEDDFITRDFQAGKYSIQVIQLRTRNHRSITVSGSKLQGDFNGKSTERPYDIVLRLDEAVKKVILNVEGHRAEELKFAQKDGKVTLTTPSIKTSSRFEVELQI